MPRSCRPRPCGIASGDTSPVEALAVRRAPHDVLRVPVAVAGRSGVEAAVNHELEQFVPPGLQRGAVPLPFSEELSAERRHRLRLLDRPDDPGHVEGVLVLRRRKAMQRVAGIAAQVVPLERGREEGEEAIVSQERADRVNTRTAIAANRTEEPKSNAELVQKAATGFREIRS